VSDGPAVAKAVYTDADFDQMCWHDCAVHALALETTPHHPGRLLVDLDYIVEWVCPIPPATTYSFWLCPATLVFDQAWDFISDINLKGLSFDLPLNALERTGPDKYGMFEWTLAGHGFSLAVRAPGFTQYLRRPPIDSPHQWLSTDQRGGLSFDQRGYNR
jgi:hypothetical protein